MVKPSELRAQSKDQLQSKEKELRAEIFQIRNQIALQSKEANPKEIRSKRKEIAQILTVLREQQLERA